MVLPQLLLEQPFPPVPRRLPPLGIEPLAEALVDQAPALSAVTPRAAPVGGDWDASANNPTAFALC